MTDNSLKIIETMQSSFPHIYNVYNKNSVLYTLISVFGERYGMRTDVIDRLYAMIGIDSTYDEDLEHRWGSLLGIYRQNNEPFDSYRNRLLIVYSSLAGGTAESIKYAIASVVGITNNDDINKYINIYDAWEYPYEIDGNMMGIEKIDDESSLYGSSICTVDLSGVDRNIDYAKVSNTINQVKASGVNAYLLFLYGIINESATLSRDDNIEYDVIKYQIKETAEFYEYTSSSAIFGEAVLGEAIFGDTSHATSRGNTDISIDNISDTVYESASLVGQYDNNQWSDFGTNSAILNKSLITNMYIEPDECVDIITFIN